MNIKLLHLSFLLLPVIDAGAHTPGCDLLISPGVQSVSCLNAEDGAIQLNASGGSGNYTFYWQSNTGSGMIPFAAVQSGLLAGNYFATVTDDAGCEATTVVVVPEEQDVEPPQLYCPLDINVNLGPGACDKIVFFSVSATDNCLNDPPVAQTDVIGLTSGDAFPIGLTTLSFATSDGYHLTECNFSITVNEYVPPPNLALACSGPLNVSLDENCSAPIDADLILLGNQHGCYDDYLLVFKNASGDTITPAIFLDYIGKNIYATVTDPETGSNCTTTLKLFDNMRPLINCIETIEVSCGASLQQVFPEILGLPEVFENCGTYTLTHNDSYYTLPCNTPAYNGQYSAYLRRTWYAEDNAGNDATPCTQFIFFKRKTLFNVVFPLHRTDQSGAAPSLDCSDSDTSPAVAGVPTIDGLPIYPQSNACDLQVTYSDHIIDGCGTSYNIFRTWTVQDNCQNQAKSHTQIIRIKDKTPPVMTCPAVWNASTNSGNCTAILFLPQPDITDDCSGYTYSATPSTGFLYNGILFNIPVGSHQVTYSATDECGNSSSCEMTLNIHDGLPPTVICDPSKQVSLTTGGTTSLSAAAFNNSSYDDCGGSLQFHIRRLDDGPCIPGGTSWSNSAKFCCDDIGSQVPVQIRATDYSGNFNFCNSVVLVTDHISPTVICPDDLQIECDDDYSDLTVFGTIVDDPYGRNPILIGGLQVGMDGLVQDNCSAVITELMPDVNIDGCGTGEIIRYFKATDPAGKTATCAQEILVVNSDPFYINPNNPHDQSDDVLYPSNTTVSGCGADVSPAQTGQPVILGNGCGEVNFTYQDQILNQNGNSYQIKRKWTVIDFCQFGSGQGVWYYFQTITVQNTDLIPPQFTGLPEVLRFCSNDINCATGFVNFSLNAADDCTPAWQLNWTYEIDLNNDGVVELTGNSGNVAGVFPMGIHRSHFTVTDQLGNSSSASVFLLVEDCAAPVPQCTDTLHVPLGSDGFLTIYAEQLQIDYSNDNCSAYGDLRFLVSFYEENINTDMPPANAVDFLSFACPDTLYPVTLWVGDEMDNWGHCDFLLHVVDWQNECEGGIMPTISIAGNIRTEENEVIQNVEVNINGALPVAVSPEGNYAFYNLPMGGDYSVNPEKLSNPLNGVSTFDMVRIRQHILGVITLNSPYKMIAADVNRSGSVTTSDLVELRKLILQIETGFSNNTSWRFIDANFVFPDPQNPFATFFPEARSYNNLATSQIVDFIGVKVGDVNGSADPGE